MKPAPFDYHAPRRVCPSDVDLTAIARLAVDDLEPPSDTHASGAHRQPIAASLVPRAAGDGDGGGDECMTRKIGAR